MAELLCVDKITLGDGVRATVGHFFEPARARTVLLRKNVRSKNLAGRSTRVTVPTRESFPALLMTVLRVEQEDAPRALFVTPCHARPEHAGHRVVAINARYYPSPVCLGARSAKLVRAGEMSPLNAYWMSAFKRSDLVYALALNENEASLADVSTALEMYSSGTLKLTYP